MGMERRWNSDGTNQVFLILFQYFLIAFPQFTFSISCYLWQKNGIAINLHQNRIKSIREIAVVLSVML